MRWYERPEILAYLVNSYAGLEGRKRQFIWEQDGNIVIGNSRAFADHLSQKFGLNLSDRAWMAVHEALRALGEVVELHSKHVRGQGKKFRNQQPEVRVIRKKEGA